MADVGVVRGSLPAPPVTSPMTTGYGTTTSVLVREVGNKIFYLNPSAAPFTLLTERAGNVGTQNPKYEWYEKSLRPKTVTSTLATTNGTTFDASDDNVMKVRDVITNVNTGEVALLTAQANATSYTIVRNLQGQGGGFVTTSGNTWLVIGSAYQEGADIQAPDEWKETHKFGLTQIFRTQFGASRTREATDAYIGKTRPRLRAEEGIAHAIDIERAFMFSVRSDGTTAGTLLGHRVTGGFTFYATSNVLALAGAALTEADLEVWLESVFQHTASGDSRTLFCSPSVITAFDQLAAERIRLVPSDKTYGIAVKQFLTGHGTLNLVKHRLLDGTFYDAGAFAVDPKMLSMRTLSGGSTKLLMDRQNPGVDGWIDEYLSEVGLQLTNPEVHGTITGVGAAA